MNITLDLETLALSPSATILQLAAIAWDPTRTDHPFLAHHPSRPYHDFSVVIDVRDSLAHGCAIDHDTLAFWQSRPQFATDYLSTDVSQLSLRDAMCSFITWIRGLKDVIPDKPLYLWTQGTDFDIPILRDKLQRIDDAGGGILYGSLAAELSRLIPYHRVRDARTYILSLARHVLTPPADDGCNTAYVPIYTPEPADTREVYRLLPPLPSQFIPEGTQSHEALYDCYRTTWNVWSIMHA